jgi:mevalonate pyrophosphate decarboxylase
MTTPRMVTMTGPVNIAVLKYWGKADVALNTPTNPSLSVTLDQADLRTTTTVVADTAFERDIIYLNGKEDEVEKGRLQSCLGTTTTTTEQIKKKINAINKKKKNTNINKKCTCARWRRCRPRTRSSGPRPSLSL